MSNSLTFQNYVESIVAGAANSKDINGEDCEVLSSNDKIALLTLLAARQAKAATTTKVVQELKGEHSAGGVITVPAFLYGQLSVVDLDNTAQIDEVGTTQFVTDGDGDVIAETGDTFTWSPVEGKHHKTRTFSVPAGVKVRYLFILA